MICPKCKSMLKDGSKSCMYCGINIDKYNEALNQRSLNPNEKYHEDYIQKIETPKQKMTVRARRDISIKKFLTVLPIVIVLIIVSIIIINRRPIINFDTEYGDYSYNEVTSTTLRYKTYINKGNKKDITFTSNCGSVLYYEGEVLWNLNDSVGKCELVAFYKSAKAKKNITVYPHVLPLTNILYENYSIGEGDNDTDGDGIIDSNEKDSLTSASSYDSDLDGISDYDEINKYDTNPISKDTDEDGLDDYNEIYLKLDPNNFTSYDDNKKDGDRVNEYVIEKDNVILNISGTGNIVYSDLKIFDDSIISKRNGLIDKLYYFSIISKSNNSKAVISYTDEELSKYNINEDYLTAFSFKINSMSYEEAYSTIDKENNTITVSIPSNDNYIVLGDSSSFGDIVNKDILFLVDNSWELFDNKQYQEMTGITYVPRLYKHDSLPGYDSNFYRFEEIKNISKKLFDFEYRVGISEFRNDYSNVIKFSTDYDSISKSLDNMKTNFKTNVNGRNVSNSLMSALSEFEDNDSDRYIVLVTGGVESSLSNSYQKIIKNAKDKNVKICIVGFTPESNNSYLKSIAYETGCSFSSVSYSKDLGEAFDNIYSSITFNITNVVDNMARLISDSEFVAARDSLPLPNYISTSFRNGHSLGMHLFVNKYYKKYDLNVDNTYFKTYTDLYGFKFRTNELKYALGYDLFNESIPIDFRVLDKDKLIINKEYRTEIDNSLIYDIVDKDYTLEDNGIGIKRYEDISLTESKLNNLKYNDEKWLFSNMNTSKANIYEYSSGIYNKGYFIDKLKTSLDNKDVPVLAFNSKNGLNVVNAISLYEDVSDSSIYYIGLYDSNYKGKKRYLSIRCINKICSTIKNDYYDTDNEVIYMFSY